MPKILQFRTGDTSSLATTLGAQAELFVDTSKVTIVVMDGVTTGGTVLATENHVTTTLQSGFSSSGIYAQTFSSNSITSTTISSNFITSNSITSTTISVGNLNSITNNTIIVSAGERLKGQDIGSVYAPGTRIQTVYKRSDVKTTYSIPISAFTEISELTTSITCKYSSSVVLIEWNLFTDGHHDHIYRISRNGVTIGTNTTDAGRWSGSFNHGYDNDYGSTPETHHFSYWDTPNTTATVTYRLLIGGSGPTAYTLGFNRPVSSAGADTNEVGISQVFITEITQ